MGEDAGVFLTLGDCMVLFPRLKGNESSLSNEERTLLLKMEKVLYGNLSVEEIEDLLEKGSPAPADGIAGRDAAFQDARFTSGGLPLRRVVDAASLKGPAGGAWRN